MRSPLLASCIITPLVAFVPSAPHAAASGGRATLAKLPRETRRSVASDASTFQDGLLPPEDETFGPVARLKELVFAPSCPDDVERYDRIGALTGGIWRTWVFGFIPSTVSRLKPRSLNECV